MDRTICGWSAISAGIVMILGLPVIAHAARPNLILIMADDLGYETIGANGGTSYRTPNLDKLAAGGARFEHCYVQPLCTPTRVQLMTGQYNVRNYLRFGYINPKSTTFGHLLKQAGYATGISGKWQLGSEPDLPQRLGFDESCLWQHTRRPPRYANAGLEYNGVEKDFSNGEYGPDLVNEFAIDFIRRHAKENFFLYYPMMLTHSPYQPTPDSVDWDPTVKDESSHKNDKYFADMVTYMDKLIGKLIDSLEEYELRENTLVVFLGDNGTGQGVKSTMGDRTVEGGKGSLKAEGMHVPLIVHWPARIRSGIVSTGLVDSTDFFPTLLDAAGVKPTGILDGQSFLAQAEGRAGEGGRKWVYSWYSPRLKDESAIRQTAFNHDFKLYASGEFYDLKADPREKNSLALGSLKPEQQAAAKLLQSVIDSFRSARPPELDQAIDIPSEKNEKKKDKAKRRGKRNEAAVE